MRAVMSGTPKNISTGIFGALAIAVGLGHSITTDSGHDRLWIALWWLALTAGLVRGVWIAISFQRATYTDDEVVAEGRRLTVNGAYCGILWGASSWIMLPTQNPAAEVFLISAIGMIIMGGAGAQAMNRQQVSVFALLTAGVFATGLFRLGDTFHALIGVAYGLFAFVILSFAKVQEVAVETAIYLGFKTEKLLAEITEQQRATDRARQDAERAKQQAELANQGKTTFLAAAGHDLRQPMHALVQYFGHLKRKNHDPELAETVVRMGKSLDAMQDLLDSILEVSKLLMGSVKPIATTFKISELLDQIDIQMRPVAEDKGLRFDIFGTDCAVHTDEVLLERILRNLTLNAIRYTNDGRVVIRAKQRGPKLVIQVFDTGIGIPTNQRERIFEALYQVANTARDRKKGLGLGLAIVKQLSDLLSVSVHLRSKPGKGSIFSIALPMTQKTVDVAPAGAIVSDRDFSRGAFVVLIDDNEESLNATATSLTEFGCHVLSAKSGFEAIERLQGQELMPHLIISDYRLEEGETGLDAIKMVIENQRALFGDDFVIPALVISGDTAPAELEKVQKSGLIMLHKPVRLEVLYQAVNERLGALATNSDAVGVN